MHDANADLVRELRVPSDAGDEAIQDALKKLFNQVQAQSSQTQSNSVSSVQQSESVSKIKSSGPDQVQASSSIQFQDQTSVQQPVSEFSSSRTTQCTVAITRSSIAIDQAMREKMYLLLTKEILYSDIIEEMESRGMNEIIRGQEKYQMKRRMLMIHVAGQPEDVQYWRTVVPDDLDVKTQLFSEFHSIPYTAHPGVQRTIGLVKCYFWWKGMAGDIREYVESCPTCQLEKTDHTLR